MRFVLSASLALAALVLLLGAASNGTPVRAATWTMEGFATGAEEVPALTHPYRVFVRFVYDDVTHDLHYQATVSGLSPNLVTAAHIHRGARGVNGPIVHGLSSTGFTQISGTIRLSAADVADLRAGNFYFNAHSVEHPGGFARFQLVLPAAATAPAAAPTPAVAPPRTGDAGLASTGDGPLTPWLGAAALALSAVVVLSLRRKRA